MIRLIRLSMHGANFNFTRFQARKAKKSVYFCRERLDQMRASQERSKFPDPYNKIHKLIQDAYPFYRFWSHAKSILVGFTALISFSGFGMLFNINFFSRFSLGVLGLFALIGISMIPRMIANWKKPELVFELEGQAWRFEKLVAHYVSLSEDLEIFEKSPPRAHIRELLAVKNRIEMFMREARDLIGRAIYEKNIDHAYLDEMIEKMAAVRDEFEY